MRKLRLEAFPFKHIKVLNWHTYVKIGNKSMEMPQQLAALKTTFKLEENDASQPPHFCKECKTGKLHFLI
eukprot:1133776-Pelagomonas_calceolata.AAC.2